MLPVDEVKKRRKNEKARKEAVRRLVFELLKEYNGKALPASEIANILGVDKRDLPLIYLPPLLSLEFRKIESYYDSDTQEWYLYTTVYWEQFAVILGWIMIVIVILLF